MIKSIHPSFAACCLAFLAATAPIGAQALSFTGCPDVTKSDFQKVPLVTRGSHRIDEPIQMAIARDGRIFWVERRGLVRSWNPSDNTASTLLDLTSTVYTGVTNQIEHGISGIALDPGFETNQWVYIFWAVKASKVFRLSRHTLAGNILTSEQPVVEIPYTNLFCCHTGGAMAFDFSGNLWVAVGNTTNNGSGIGSKNPDSATNYVNEADFHGDDQRGSANTNSLLGKILRIKPRPVPTGTSPLEPGPGRTYDIPAGNLFPAGQFPADKTRPEIYTMGHRNPYSLTLDPYRNWLTWGEIGPDEFGASDTVKTEEHNLVTAPGFMGWPYFVGRNQRFRLNKDPAKPTNTSRNNTGLTDLPPAQAAIHPYGHAAAVTGPIYYYDGRLPSKTRLPPHFNKKWLFTDFNAGYVDVATVDETGKSLTATARFWAGGFLIRPLDMEVGPDGNLYVLDYSGWFGPGSETGIARVEYKGNCLPTELTPPTVVMQGKSGAAIGGADRGGSNLIRLGDEARIRLPEGMGGAQVFDLHGRKLQELRSPRSRGPEGTAGGMEMPVGLETGLYLVRYLP